MVKFVNKRNDKVPCYAIIAMVQPISCMEYTTLPYVTMRPELARCTYVDALSILLQRTFMYLASLKSSYSWKENYSYIATYSVLRLELKMVDSIYRTRSLGVASEGIPDQYADGKAAKVWEYYIGSRNERTDVYRSWITQLLREKNCKRVLDVACGTG